MILRFVSPHVSISSSINRQCLGAYVSFVVGSVAGGYNLFALRIPQRSHPVLPLLPNQESLHPGQVIEVLCLLYWCLQTLNQI